LSAGLPSLAYIIERDGPVYAPLFEKLERELAAMRSNQNVVDRAKGATCQEGDTKVSRDEKMIAKEIEIVFVPCSKCVRETKHHILFQTTQHDEQTMDTYALLSCCGCENISLGHRRLWLNDGSVQNFFYPSPVSRKEPDWVFWLRFGNTENLAELLSEIYKRWMVDNIAWPPWEYARCLNRS
jgi:hypothetical protein